MAEGYVQLILILGLCFMVGFIPLAIVFGEAQQIKKARAAGQLQSGSERYLSIGERSTRETSRVSSGQARKEGATRQTKHPSMLTEQYEDLWQMGFTEEQIEYLIIYRDAYRRSHYQTDILMPARLGFARWLYKHGKITD